MKKSLSNTNGTFTLCKCILGASLVILPSIYAKLGLFLGTALILFFMTVNVYSLSFIMQAGKETMTENLTQLGGSLNRKYGENVVTFLLLSTVIVPLIFYIEITTKYLHNVLDFFDYKVNLEIVRIATFFICCVMCIVFRKSDKLQYISLVGLGALFLLTLYICVLFVQDFGSFDFSGYKYAVFNKNSMGAISCICFAFCSQFGILSITSDIYSIKDCKIVIWSSHVVSAMIYIITGMLGYFIKPDENSNFLEIMPVNRITVSLKFALGVVNISTYPLIMIAARSALHFFVMKIKKIKPNFVVDGIESCFVVLIAYACSILVSKNSAYLENMFFLSGSLVMFALPSYFYAKTVKKRILYLLCSCILTTC